MFTCFHAWLIHYVSTHDSVRHLNRTSIVAGVTVVIICDLRCDVTVTTLNLLNRSVDVIFRYLYLVL